MFWPSVYWEMADWRKHYNLSWLVTNLSSPDSRLTFVQALLKMVTSYSTVALSPPNRDALTESPLRIVLFALRKMCDHAICQSFIRSSELLPVIAHLQQSPDRTISEYASDIATKVHRGWSFSGQVQCRCSFLCTQGMMFVNRDSGAVYVICSSRIHHRICICMYIWRTQILLKSRGYMNAARLPTACRWLHVEHSSGLVQLACYSFGCQV